jgi:hypothetical protein
VKRLQEIGFVWSVYGKDKPSREKTAKLEKTEPEQVKTPEVEERLYHVISEYIQHNGVDPLPEKLVSFIKKRGGEFPSYIPLPNRPLLFRMGGDHSQGAKIRWVGRGPLPEEVRDYLNENGVLPPHD